VHKLSVISLLGAPHSFWVLLYALQCFCSQTIPIGLGLSNEALPKHSISKVTA